MDDEAEWDTLAVLHPDHMNPKELAVFVTAAATLHGVRTRVEDETLVCVRKRPKSPPGRPPAG